MIWLKIWKITSRKVKAKKDSKSVLLEFRKDKPFRGGPSGKGASSSYSKTFRSSSQKRHGNSSQWDKRQGMDKSLSKETHSRTHSRTVLQKLQENLKNINILFKRNRLLGFDNQSKIYRHIFFKILSTKEKPKFSFNKENKVFSIALGKTSRGQNILQIVEGLKLEILRTTFPGNHPREISTPMIKKYFWIQK